SRDVCVLPGGLRESVGEFSRNVGPSSPIHSVSPSPAGEPSVDSWKEFTDSPAIGALPPPLFLGNLWALWILLRPNQRRSTLSHRLKSFSVAVCLLSAATLCITSAVAEAQGFIDSATSAGLRAPV